MSSFIYTMQTKKHIRCFMYFNTSTLNPIFFQLHLYRYILYNRQISRDMRKFCVVIIRYHYPHHDTTSTVAVHFLNTGGRETLIPAPVYPYSDISFLQEKTEFVTNPNSAAVVKCPAP